MALWLGVVLVSAFQHRPADWASVRVLGTAWDMWNHEQYWVPLHNGQPDPNVMPLIYWLIHAGWTLSGVNDAWPRLLQAVLGAIWLGLGAALARQWAPLEKHDGVPWLLIAGALPLVAALQISNDLLTAVCVVAALLALSGRPAWLGFTLSLAAGLLTAGPLMLGFVALPLLLGPWWSASAREDRRRWYRRARLSTLTAIVIFLTWASFAGTVGGAAYRVRLMAIEPLRSILEIFEALTQPAALALLAALLLPWALWPRLWRAVFAWRRPFDDASRFALTVVASGLVLALWVPRASFGSVLAILPMAGIVLIGALRAHEATGAPPSRFWGPWPFACLMLMVAILVGWGVPWLAARADAPPWIHLLASWSAGITLVLAILAGLLLSVPHALGAQLRTTATVSLLVLALGYGLFARLFAAAFDPEPAATLIARAAAAGQPIARIGRYQGELHFYAHLTEPVAEITETDVLVWARAHTSGLIVQYPEHADATALRAGALLVAPFGRRWMVIWPAAALLSAPTPLSAGRPNRAALPLHARRCSGNRGTGPSEQQKLHREMT
ncbi:4-amino-4-deoxy-L-arabinose transferase-like glycosyltransferase [Tahibacter aquaticus]|uniref:4-amino-4-deoxy-L-arabinose transferase-like glycosyltransferase n=1 Tax=Tahibacter aquaticus TaxID=520092 RepID=A0A4R6Z2A5_9GAMM|nr:hypothetical protein [Tahibacter aquaticus]TDR45599.1 4-amino-4-deoxy-L-arabinose transferase-like glycosyltransferase [Tahibacter aquaticus]